MPNWDPILSEKESYNIKVETLILETKQTSRVVTKVKLLTTNK